MTKNFRLCLRQIWGKTKPLSIALAVLAVLSAAAMTGCSSTKLYAGPARPSDQVALLFRHANYVKILSVDGHGLSLLNLAKKLELLPGPHTIEFNFRAEYADTGYTSGTATNGIVKMSFDAKAGYTYWIDSNVNPFREQWNPKLISRPTNSEEPAE